MKHIVYEFNFGDDKEIAEKLKRLVLSGKKTATTGLHDDLVKEGKEIPKVDEYAAIVDSNERRFCVIQYTNIEKKSFLEVDFEYIQKEGEDDKDIEEWREKHRKFYSYNLSFNDNSIVVCEEFKLITVI